VPKKIRINGGLLGREQQSSLTF